MKFYELLDSKDKACCIKFVHRNSIYFLTPYNALTVYGDYEVRNIFYKDTVKVFEIERAGEYMTKYELRLEKGKKVKIL